MQNQVLTTPVTDAIIRWVITGAGMYLAATNKATPEQTQILGDNLLGVIGAGASVLSGIWSVTHKIANK